MGKFQGNNHDKNLKERGFARLSGFVLSNTPIIKKEVSSSFLKVYNNGKKWILIYFVLSLLLSIVSWLTELYDWSTNVNILNRSNDVNNPFEELFLIFWGTLKFYAVFTIYLVFEFMHDLLEKFQKFLETHLHSVVSVSILLVFAIAFNIVIGYSYYVSSIGSGTISSDLPDVVAYFLCACNLLNSFATILKKNSVQKNLKKWFVSNAFYILFSLITAVVYVRYTDFSDSDLSYMETLLFTFIVNITPLMIFGFVNKFYVQSKRKMFVYMGIVLLVVFIAMYAKNDIATVDIQQYMTISQNIQEETAIHYFASPYQVLDVILSTLMLNIMYVILPIGLTALKGIMQFFGFVVFFYIMSVQNIKMNVIEQQSTLSIEQVKKRKSTYPERVKKKQVSKRKKGK